MIPNDLHYNFPLAIYLLVLVPAIFILLSRLYIFRENTLERFANPEILNKVLIPRSHYNYWGKVTALCGIWVLATLALMQPKGNGHYPLEGAIEAIKPKEKEKDAIVQRKAHDIIFLVDASASMDVADTRTSATRFDYAKEIVDEVISRLRGESVALYAFTSDTTKLSPLTMDYLFARLMLRQMQINEGDIAGTNLVEALADMRDFYFSTITPKQKTLVILTDGGDTRLEELSGQAKKNQLATMLNLVGNADVHQLRVFTIGLGTKQGKEVPGVLYDGKPVVSSLDETLLKNLSDKGRGEYFFANDRTAPDLASALVTKMGEDKAQLEEYKVQRRAAVTRGGEDLVYDLLFQYPLGLAIFLLGLVLFFPDSRKLKKGLPLLIFFIYATHAEARDNILVTRQAEAYFEAGEYGRSIELFQKLEGEKLHPWQHYRVLYNIGTSHMAEKNWKGALEAYTAIPYSKKKAPLLGKALKLNTAIIQYRQASSLLAKEKLSLNDYRKAFYLYRDSLQNIEEAEKANCLLQSRMGENYCRRTEDLADLHTAVKRELAIVTKKYGEAKIAESPPKEGIPVLLSGVKLALSHIDFLTTKNLNDKLKKRYLKLFARDAESWLSLWDMQMEQIAELEGARQYYLEGIYNLKMSRLNESRLDFLEASASLSKLMEELWGLDPLLEMLQRLLTAYQRVLDQTPIQTATLYQLHINQEQVRKIVSAGDVSEQELNFSYDFLRKSLKYARQGKVKHTRFFVEEAQQWIRRLLRQQTLPGEELPEEVLENAIQEQEHAWILNYLAQEMEGDKKTAREILRKSQLATLRTAEPYIRAVLTKEARDFPIRCQRTPWEKVIPLFDSGLRAAKQAEEILKITKHPMAASSLQEKAIEQWKKALRRMRDIEEEEEKPPEPPKPHPPPPEGPPPPSAPETSMQEVLQLLQKMNQQDRLPKPQDTIPQQGRRPW